MCVRGRKRETSVFFFNSTVSYRTTFHCKRPQPPSSSLGFERMMTKLLSKKVNSKMTKKTGKQRQRVHILMLIWICTSIAGGFYRIKKERSNVEENSKMIPFKLVSAREQPFIQCLLVCQRLQIMRWLLVPQTKGCNDSPPQTQIPDKAMPKVEQGRQRNPR